MKLLLVFGMFFWSLASTFLAAAENTGTASAFIWRDAQPSAETELDRLNHAFVQLAEHARPAIVQIRVTTREARGKTGEALGSRGSGFIVDSHGFILTAEHVIEKAKEIEIRLADAQRLPAQIVAADAQIDVAVLKIKAVRELPILPLADSDSIRVGDLALVFGYPFGRDSSMSLGIISRAGRT